MANKNLLTYNAKISQLEQAYYAPVSTISSSSKIINTTYCFLSRIDPWTASDEPEQPRQDQKYIKNVFKNMFVAKKINSSDISPVIHRINWTSGETYDYYQDDIDILEKDSNGFNIYNFYVKNKYDQVFKCLWNNNNSPSTIEPYFQPGTYGTNNIYCGLDGYKWKYIYSITMGQKIKFMDSTWMPVPIGYNALNPKQTSSGSGDIEAINVINGGSGYDQTAKINIIGDGTGAVALPEITNGVITDILVTSTGTNYTYANITVDSLIGAGAIVTGPTSPIGGHGFDAISEFGANHIMYTVEFNGSESGKIPTDIDFRQIGLITNPTTLNLYPNPATSDIYKISTDFLVASGFGAFSNDEIIYQGANLATATFTAMVLSFDSAANVINLINITGTPILNSPVSGNSSGCVRTLFSVSYPEFVIESGYLTYVENRSGIQRSPDGIEQFKFVLEY
jgi:hypothetical protein